MAIDCLALINESEIELDDRFINFYEGKLKTAAKGAAAGAAGAAAALGGYKAAEKVVGAGGPSNITGAVKKVADMVKDHANTDPGAAKAAVSNVGKEIMNSPVAGAMAGGALAAIGAAALYRYKNSIMRSKYLVNHYSKLMSSAKDPASKAKIGEKLKVAKQKLADAQSKARTEHASFIAKSQELKAKIAELNKAGRKPEAAKLQAKLQKRQGFLSKIGATV